MIFTGFQNDDTNYAVLIEQYDVSGPEAALALIDFMLKSEWFEKGREQLLLDREDVLAILRAKYRPN